MAIASRPHKVGSRVVIFSCNGHGFRERSPFSVREPRKLPPKSAVLDSEVVASGVDGRPNFVRRPVALAQPQGQAMGQPWANSGPQLWAPTLGQLWAKPGPVAVHLYAFDHLAFNGCDFGCSPGRGRNAGKPTLVRANAAG